MTQAYKDALKLFSEQATDNPRQLLAMLFEDLLGITNIEKTTAVSGDHWAIIKNAVVRLNEGEPLQYVTQTAHFYGLKYFVDKRVLIPRSETEELVYHVLQHISKSRQDNLKLLDIGTGSGCIALTIKHKVADVSVTALEISSAALEVVEINRKKLALSVALVEDDITCPADMKIRSGKWDYIVSNPPYIQKSELHLLDTRVINYEPRQALFPADGNPFAMYRSILDYSWEHLHKDGHLFLELNEFLASSIKSMATDLGFSDTRIIMDMQGKSRILQAQRNPA